MILFPIWQKTTVETSLLKIFFYFSRISHEKTHNKTLDSKKLLTSQLAEHYTIFLGLVILSKYIYTPEKWHAQKEAISKGKDHLPTINFQV